MKLPIFVAQFPITLSIPENLDHILQILDHTQPGDLVIFPEGAISGYSIDLSFLDDLDLEELQNALVQVRSAAKKRQIFLFIGSIIKNNEDWINAGFGFTPQGEEFRYDKINLATHERGVLTPGDSLPIFELDTKEGPVKIGIQLCRELRYPEQWGLLARKGTQIIIHLTNAVGAEQYQPVWRSHLISRAAETQRFVISANNAGQEQISPTMAVAPDGQVLGEIVSEKAVFFQTTINLELVSNWYLNQCRDDIVAIKQLNR